MTAPDEPRTRRVIPRWREAAASVETGEGRLSGPAAPVTEHAEAIHALRRLHGDFTAEPNIGTAAELVSAALLFGAPEHAQDAAEFLLMRPEATTSSALHGAREALGLGGLDAPAQPTAPAQLSVTTLGAQVGEVRARLRAFPFNALAHLDLARLSTALGRDERAERHLKVAMGLAPHHRLTIRAVTRFLIHQQEPDRALRFLRRQDIVRQDPWLMATEIATATVAGRPQLLVRQARSVLDAQQHPPLHTSELAASIATLDVLDGGHAKRVRQLMIRALQDPTENAVAQARWIGKQVKLDMVRASPTDVPRNFEARAYEAYQAQHFDTARELFVDWLRDEPFSSRPALMAGYLSDLLDGTPHRAIELTRIGLSADTTDATLHNNLAFFLAQDGQVDKAHVAINAAQTHAEESETATILATRGFIAFRAGDPDRGQQLYMEAIQQSRAQRDNNGVIKAQLYLARELIRSRAPEGQALLTQVLELLQTRTDPDLAAVASRIQRELPAIGGTNHA